MKITLFRIITAAALIAWMCLIFFLSGQDAVKSSKTSSGVIKAVAQVIVPEFKELPQERQIETVKSMQGFARKMAHFSIFGFLGVLSVFAMISYKRLSYLLRGGISALICLLYAASDEFHQLFVPGRSGELRDVMIDFSGALIGICASMLIIWLISRYIRRKKSLGETA